jgi:glyoxylase I family protein
MREANPINIRSIDHQAPNLDHFCLQVQPWDGDTIRKHLRAHDVDVDEIVTRYGATGYAPSLYIRDPDGNRIELKGTNG